MHNYLNIIHLYASNQNKKSSKIGSSCIESLFRNHTDTRNLWRDKPSALDT